MGIIDDNSYGKQVVHLNLLLMLLYLRCNPFAGEACEPAPSIQRQGGRCALWGIA
jgi:hypothetical protein